MSAATARGPLVFVLAVAGIAVGWRLIDATDWPARWYPTLQYESALAARTVWLKTDPRALTPDRAAWLDAVGTGHIVSPPILPGLVAAVYALVGDEVPWVSRLFTTGFWVAAGGLIGSAALRLTGSRWAGAAAFAWFVLCPFGMLMSRSFQTEPLLVFAFAWAVRHLAGSEHELSWRRTLTAGLVCGAAALVKPGVLFPPLIAGFVAVVWPRSVPGTWWQKLLHVAVFSALVVLPGTAYAALLLKHHAGRIMPHLLVEGWFYRSVAENIREAVGPGLLTLGLLGIGLAARSGRFLPLGLLAGHFASLAVFSFHAATHDYYQVPLLVILALGLAWPVAAAEGWVLRRGWSRVRVALLLALAVGIYLVWTADPDIGPWRWLPDSRADLAAAAAQRQQQAERAVAVREAVGSHARFIELTAVYGYPLQYHGWVRGVKWPSVEDRAYLVQSGTVPAPFSAEAYLRHMMSEANWQFFVVTDEREWDRQPDLQAALARFGPPVASRPGLRVYELRRP